MTKDTIKPMTAQDAQKNGVPPKKSSAKKTPVAPISGVEPIDWQKEYDEELKRWEERQKFLQQEFVRELGIHQGRISVFGKQLNPEEGVAEEKGD